MGEILSHWLACLYEVEIRVDLIAFENGAAGHLLSNIPVLLIDAVSLVVLSGLIACTHVFRKRNRLSDRLFLAMVVMDIILAVSDVVMDLFAGFGMGNAGIIGSLFYSIATLGSYLIAAFAVLYLLCFLPGGEGLLRKWYRLCLIPVICIFVILIVNFFDVTVFTVTEDWVYLYGPYSWLVMSGLAVYAAAALPILWQINKPGIIPFLFVIFNVAYTQGMLFDISFLVLSFTAVLVFLLVEDMNRSFHREAGS